MNYDLEAGYLVGFWDHCVTTTCIIIIIILCLKVDQEQVHEQSLYAENIE